MRTYAVFACLVFAIAIAGCQTLPKSSASLEFIVFGCVYNPGRYGAKEGVTLLQAVKLAGGLSQRRIRSARVCRIEGEEVKSIYIRIKDWGKYNLKNGDCIEVLDPM